MDLSSDAEMPGYYLTDTCSCVTVTLQQIHTAKQRGSKLAAEPRLATLFSTERLDIPFSVTNYTIREQLHPAQVTIYCVQK